jgi:hypothetical protein
LNCSSLVGICVSSDGSASLGDSTDEAWDCSSIGDEAWSSVRFSSLFSSSGSLQLTVSSNILLIIAVR